MNWPIDRIGPRVEAGGTGVGRQSATNKIQRDRGEGISAQTRSVCSPSLSLSLSFCFKLAKYLFI